MDRNNNTTKVELSEETEYQLANNPDDYVTQYRYKMMGKPAIYNSEMLFLFKLTDFELFIIGGKRRHSYLPEDWREYFGVPVENHEESYKIDLADGYITTDKA